MSWCGAKAKRSSEYEDRIAAGRRTTAILSDSRGTVLLTCSSRYDGMMATTNLQCGDLRRNH